MVHCRYIKGVFFVVGKEMLRNFGGHVAQDGTRDSDPSGDGRRDTMIEASPRNGTPTMPVTVAELPISMAITAARRNTISRKAWG